MDATLDISDARKQFNTLDKRLKDDPVILVTRYNKAAFAVVDIEYLQAMQETMDVLSDPGAAALLAQSIRDIAEGRLHDHEDVAREPG